LTSHEAKRSAAATTSFLLAHEKARKRARAKIPAVNGQQRSSIMWTLLSLIYRLSCRARLLEMRKRHLAAAGW
jgi:hypothetical protein